MTNWIFQAIVLIVSAWSVFRGFRLALTGQLSSLLGMAFGIAFARVLTPEYTDAFMPLADWIDPGADSGFVANELCASIVYVIIYSLFGMTSKVLRGAISVFEVGMLNRLGGIFFCMLKNLLWVSMAYNLLLCMNPDCGLMAYEKADDGNLVAAVMDICPGLLGCLGAAELAHFMQLKEAAKISCNFKCLINVIT